MRKYEALEYDEYGEIKEAEQEIKKVPRIPLAKRLEGLKKKKPNFLNIFEISTFVYFATLSEMSMDFYFIKRYEDFVFEKGDRKPRLLSSCMHDMDSLLPEDRERMMYYILIEPFVKIPAIPKYEREMKG